MLRAQLDPIVGARIDNVDSRRIAIDILTNIWVKSEAANPVLHAAALALYRNGAGGADRVWLHYGMTLLTYDFFVRCVATVGQLSRTQDSLTPAEVKRVLIAQRGALGSLAKAVERVLFSLRNWGILQATETRYAYAPTRRGFGASSRALEMWMLAVLLRTYTGDEMAFVDLMRRPELFPFQLRVTVDELRQNRWFVVQRQGAAIDMIRLDLA